MTIGFYPMGLCGIEIIRVDENENKVTWLYMGTQAEQRAHTTRIYYTNNGRGYFMFMGQRIHLDECMRTVI